MLDALAAEGVRCTNAITQNPICTPSRMCWLSGQYCHNHGSYGLSGPKPPTGLPTVLGHFRGHGYRTAGFVSGFTLNGEITDLDRGFHHYNDGGKRTRDRRGPKTVEHAERWLEANVHH